MNDGARKLEIKIKEKKAKVAVVGLGYVGLPLALEFARKGFSVTGIELDPDRLNNIKRARSYITDVSTAELRKVLRTYRFSATSDFRVLKSIDVIIICVPTPLKRKYLPDISYIKHAVASISKNIKHGSLVVLESTTYPGTTDEVILPVLESRNLKHNLDFYLCFSPERIDPGNKAFPVKKIPKVIGGISSEATKLGVLLYGNIIDKVVPVSSARTAEAVKLLENTFRLINIALIDELAMMANKMRINIWEVIDAASTKPFGFMPFYPGPGVGGHCIPKDPLYLYWKAKHFGFRSRFIKLASDIINYMPGYIAQRIEESLRTKGRALRGSRILVLGVTYKKDVLDLRKSPAIDIINILKSKKAEVSFFDPIVPYLRLAEVNLKSVKLNKESIRRFDCILIATDHTNIDYQMILRNARLIFDARRVYKKERSVKVVTL